MTDLFLQIGLSNACFSLALAIVAMVVGATTERPHLAHLLWLLVFVKLMTPPIVTIPVIAIPTQPDVLIEDHSAAIAQMSESSVDASPLARTWSVMLDHGRAWLPPIWLMGCVFVSIWSLVRVCRFSRLLAEESEVGKEELQIAAAKIACQLELKTVPTIYTTSARLSPMVWWIGGNVRIVIPAAVLDKMDAQQWQWILAHELAHVRRRDYLVRWLEWVACACFWWNPVVWWAQRNLRAAEEICCDALVMSCLKPKPHSYANSLLTAVEFLACPAIRPPAMASEINSGGFLERRFKMIVSETPNRSSSRWLQACVLLCAVVVLPLGVAYAAVEEDRAAYLERIDTDGDGEISEEERLAASMARRAAIGERMKAFEARLCAAVEAGEMTEEDGRARLDGLRERLGQRRARQAFAAAAEKIRAAIEAGEITAEQGRARLAGLRERLGQRVRGKDQRAKYAAAAEKIRAAIEAGEISEEDGKARLDGYRKSLGQRVDWGAIRRRIEGAVEAGDITREEADAKYREIREKMARGDKRGEMDWDAIRERIEGAVEEGKITREEADEMLEAYQRRMAMAAEYEAFVQRIKAAVEAGEMTREQAGEEIEGYRGRMRGGEEGILMLRGKQIPPE